MSSQIWPYLSDADRLLKEEASLSAERTWLLTDLQSALPSLLSTLQDCLSLLSPPSPSSDDRPTPSSVLALSSHRSESIKGIITRSGTRLSTSLPISLRLPSLSGGGWTGGGSGWAGAGGWGGSTTETKDGAYPLHLHHPFTLPQLTHLLRLLNTALDIIDISRWTGSPLHAPFISAQLKLLADTIDEARSTLKGGDDTPASAFKEGGTYNSGAGSEGGGRYWYEQSKSEIEDTWGASLPPTLVPWLNIADAAVVLQVRTLGPAPSREGEGTGGSLTGWGIRTKLGLGGKVAVHDEMGETFVWQGEEVGVREKVKVESQDPSLMAVMAKLGALAHAVGTWRVKVGVVMGEDIEV